MLWHLTLLTLASAYSPRSARYLPTISQPSVGLTGCTKVRLPGCSGLFPAACATALRSAAASRSWRCNSGGMARMPAQMHTHVVLASVIEDKNSWNPFVAEIRTKAWPLNACNPTYIRSCLGHSMTIICHHASSQATGMYHSGFEGGCIAVCY